MKHTINLLLIVLLFSCTKKKDDPIPQQQMPLLSNKIASSGCNNQTIYTDTTMILTVRKSANLYESIEDHLIITENCDSIIIQFKDGTINSDKTPLIHDYTTVSKKFDFSSKYVIWSGRDNITNKVWYYTYVGIVYSKIYK